MDTPRLVAALEACDRYSRRWPFMPAGPFLRAQVRLHLEDAAGSLEDLGRASGLSALLGNEAQANFAVFHMMMAAVLLGDEARFEETLSAELAASPPPTAPRKRPQSGLLNKLTGESQTSAERTLIMLKAYGVEFGHERAPSFLRLFASARAGQR